MRGRNRQARTSCEGDVSIVPFEYAFVLKESDGEKGGRLKRTIRFAEINEFAVNLPKCSVGSASQFSLPRQLFLEVPQEALLVGYKGSGKSTIFDVLRHLQGLKRNTLAIGSDDSKSELPALE